jgi:hypothetical protein
MFLWLAKVELNLYKITYLNYKIGQSFYSLIYMGCGIVIKQIEHFLKVVEALLRAAGELN